MGVREVFTCDRCGKEVRRKADLRYFQAELDHDIDKKSSGARDPIGLEVCHDCGGELMSALHAAISRGGEQVRSEK